jgi:hypothetical protein
LASRPRLSQPLPPPLSPPPSPPPSPPLGRRIRVQPNRFDPSASRLVPARSVDAMKMHGLSLPRLDGSTRTGTSGLPASRQRSVRSHRSTIDYKTSVFLTSPDPSAAAPPASCVVNASIPLLSVFVLPCQFYIMLTRRLSLPPATLSQGECCCVTQPRRSRHILQLHYLLTFCLLYPSSSSVSACHRRNYRQI